MLSDLDTVLPTAKANDLAQRLEHCRTDSALAAEAELAMLWAISRVAQLTPEPAMVSDSRRPDAFSSDLFASRPAYIEVRALSDDSFSGRDAMDRTANIISAYADQLRANAGRHLYFEFLERRYWSKHFCRERCVDPAFQLRPLIRSKLKDWIMASDWPSPETIRLTDEKTDVVVIWKKSTLKNFRTHSSMPAVAYDYEENPIYKALKKKARQIKGAPPSALKCVFLVDTGCDLLRSLQATTGGGWEIPGKKLIWYALKKLNIDVVCVFSPWRAGYSGFVPGSYLRWNVTCFDSRSDLAPNEHEKLDRLANSLPPPRLEAYLARSLHEQGFFNVDGGGWPNAASITTQGNGLMAIRISSRLMQEYLAGNIDCATFQHRAFGGRNYFEMELVSGRSIQGVHFESGGVDADDDYVVFDLNFDLRMKPFKKVT